MTVFKVTSFRHSNMSASRNDSLRKSRSMLVRESNVGTDARNKVREPYPSKSWNRVLGRDEQVPLVVGNTNGNDMSEAFLEENKTLPETPSGQGKAGGVLRKVFDTSSI